MLHRCANNYYMADGLSENNYCLSNFITADAMILMLIDALISIQICDLGLNYGSYIEKAFIYSCIIRYELARILIKTSSCHYAFLIYFNINVYLIFITFQVSDVFARME